MVGNVRTGALGTVSDDPLGAEPGMFGIGEEM